MALATRDSRLVAAVTWTLAGGLAAPLAAQTTGAPESRPWYVTTAKWAKWPTLAAAIGFTTVAILRKDDADAVYAVLQDYCKEDSQRCVLNTAGAYADGNAEALYQETLQIDGKARRWMLGGQAFLFVSGGLFLLDLVSGSSKPKNIPFAPLEAFAAPGKMGVRWRF
jgi:hypothetical protein